MRVSIIATVKNEAETIEDLLNSILSQSYLPDEVIIVDGGSRDRTVEILDSYKRLFKKFGIRYEVIIENNVNISKGRNIAIKHANSEIIVSVDGGCILHEDFIRNIVTPLIENSQIDVVGGRYEALIQSRWDEVIAELTIPHPRRILRKPESFLPSARAIAFRKKCWELVGGFPEWLYTGEDTVFDIMLKKAGCKFLILPNAVVYWRLRKNLKELFRQYFKYAEGDGQARIFQFKYLLTSYLPIFVGLVLITLSFLLSPSFLALLLVGILLYPIIRTIYNGGNAFKVVKNLDIAIPASIILILAATLGYSWGTIKSKIGGITK
ncbi:glycosyltransferase [Pyrococcus kukulkanii]|uniref:glycosyltransferase n=1 Tax=Pyrococcus kukulkanii TaxID=1609559 RepID=UPI0035676417